MYGTGDEQESGLIGNKGWTSLQSFKQCSNFQQFFYLQHCLHWEAAFSHKFNVDVPPPPCLKPWVTRNTYTCECLL